MKNVKKIFGLLLTIMVSIVGLNTSNAVESDATISFYNRKLSFTPYYDFGTTYKEVTTSQGKKIAYCFNKKLNAPPTGTTLSKTNDSLLPNEVKTSQYIYILDNGYGGNWNANVIGSGDYNVDQKYYITQLALWIAQGSADANTVKGLGTLGNAAYNLYNAAVKNASTIAYKPEVSFTGTPNMHLVGSNYVSDEITVNIKVATKGNIALVDTPVGSKFIINGKEASNTAEVTNGTKIKVLVPANAVTKSTTIKVVGYSTATWKRIQVYKYNGNDSYQNIGLIYPEKHTATAELKAPITATGELIIEKVEMVDNKPVKLNGVTLALISPDGKEIARWNTSDENPKTIKNLQIGATYTISEITAPEGYKKITNKTVTVDSATAKKVTIENSKVTKVKISKQDITTKEELPGAKLVVKDEQGNVIDEWVSTTEPHYITKELKAGKYTVSETAAPEGYALTTETATFTIDSNGNVSGDVVMYNAPKKGVIISKQDATNGKELPGATLVLKDADGNIIDKWVSTKTPHYIKDLPEGHYILIETIPPKGFELSEEVKEFDIKYDGKDTPKIVMLNDRIPKTGDMNVTFVIAGLISALAVGTFSFIKIAKKA